MKTSDVQTSLQLKDAGFPQDGKFFWRIEKENPVEEQCLLLDHTFDSSVFDFVSAPTLDELLAQVKKIIKIKPGIYWLCIEPSSENYANWAAGYRNTKQWATPFFEEDSLFEALAKLWLQQKKGGFR